MQPVNDRRRLLLLHQQLGKALQQDDWDAVIKTDQEIREMLQRLASRPHLSEEVQQAKDQLKKLHAYALMRCTESCERLWEQLLDHLEHAEARAAYQQVGLFGAEEVG